MYHGAAVVFFFLVTALAVTSGAGPEVRSPYRMGDWTVCRDGTERYERNATHPLDPPPEIACSRHGGVLAYGPGKRLNER
jgi:hypothetical protein